MADRQLPTRLNPKLDIIDDDPEKWQEYVDKRRLGQTDVPVDEGSTKLKPLDYAYSRVPLPKDLKGSGVFKDRVDSSKGHYYLMRRSSDGFISGTGMFRLAFPWASEEEEEAEKRHLRTLDGADQQEVARNLWIPVPEALELADEYNLRNWILVLLDQSPIVPHANTNVEIKAPPQYIVTAKHRPKNKAEKTHMASSSSAPTPSTRKRSTRSQSPEKSAPAATPRKMATPKTAKRGPGRPTNASRLAATAEADGEEESDDPVGAKGGARAGSEAPPARDVRKTETASTPSSARRSELTQNVKQTIEQLKERTADVVNQSGGGRKRKLREVEAEDEATDAASGNKNADANADADAGATVVTTVQPSAKRARVTELEVREQRLKNRALTGILVSFLAGSAIPLLGSYL